MIIQMNGEKTEVMEDISVYSLINNIKINNKKIAVELNGNIVPKSQYHEIILKENDVLEIVSAIGGG